MQIIGLTTPKERDLLRKGKRKDRDGQDGPGRDMYVLSFKSVKLSIQVKIKNSEIRKLFSSPQLLRKRLVVQTWSWASSLRSDAKYRPYGPNSAIVTPKGDKTRQDWERRAWSRQGSTWF